MSSGLLCDVDSFEFAPWMHVIWIVALVIALPAAFLSFAVWNSIRSLSNPNLRLEPVDERQFPAQYAAAAQHHAWAINHGYEWLGGFLLRTSPQSFIALWRKQDGYSYFCVYYVTALGEQNSQHEFVTLFDGDRTLDTSSTKDAQLFPPRPGTFIQSFSGLPIDQLYQYHLQGVEYLRVQGGFQPPWTKIPPVQHILQGLRQQTDFVRSFALWPLRGVWWYFTRRGRMHNQPVEQLYPPYELHSAE